MRFYPNFAHVGCGHGCNAKLQALTFAEEGYPLDTDWPELQRIFDLHNTSCSPANLYTQDPNAFFGNPDSCYEEPGYCEF